MLGPLLILEDRKFSCHCRPGWAVCIPTLTVYSCEYFFVLMFLRKQHWMKCSCCDEWPKSWTVTECSTRRAGGWCWTWRTGWMMWFGLGDGLISYFSVWNRPTRGGAGHISANKHMCLLQQQPCYKFTSFIYFLESLDIRMADGWRVIRHLKGFVVVNF